MKTLIGTEKQIKYAESLRDNLIKNMNSDSDNLKNDLNETTDMFGNPIDTESIHKEIDKLENIVNIISDFSGNAGNLISAINEKHYDHIITIRGWQNIIDNK